MQSCISASALLNENSVLDVICKEGGSRAINKAIFDLYTGIL